MNVIMTLCVVCVLMAVVIKNEKSDIIPVNIRRCFDVVKTLLTSKQRCVNVDVKTTCLLTGIKMKDRRKKNTRNRELELYRMICGLLDAIKTIFEGSKDLYKSSK